MMSKHFEYRKVTDRLKPISFRKIMGYWYDYERKQDNHVFCKFNRRGEFLDWSTDEPLKKMTHWKYLERPESCNCGDK